MDIFAAAAALAEDKALAADVLSVEFVPQVRDCWLPAQQGNVEGVFKGAAQALSGICWVLHQLPHREMGACPQTLLLFGHDCPGIC